MRSLLFIVLALFVALTSTLGSTRLSAAANEEAAETAAKKAKEERQNAEIRKSFDELKAAVQKLATQIGEQIDDADTDQATTWVRSRLAELEESLNSAGQRLEDETGAAGEDARKKTGDLLKGLADAVGSLGETVAKTSDGLKTKRDGGEAEGPAADSLEK
jgi:chromosome segregation ATPase